MTTQNSMIDLSANFTLVRVSISMVGNTRQQKDLACEIEASKGATVGSALKVNKILFDPAALKAIGQARNAIACAFRENTSVWGEETWRLLPTHRWVEYGNTMTPLFAAFEREADALAEYNNFRNLLDEARVRLGTLFNREDYPEDETAFRAKFAIVDQSRSIESAEDAKRIRSLPVEVVERIERSMQAQQAANMARVQTEAFDKLHTVTIALRDSLKNWQSGNQKSFKSTLWDTVEKACSFCQQFNLSGDSSMTALVEEIRNSLLTIDPDTIRENPVAVNPVILAADVIAGKAAQRKAAMANMSGYMN